MGILYYYFLYMYKEKVEFLTDQARKIDPFFKKVNSKKMFSEIRDELDEAWDEYEKWEYTELEDELWDVFRDYLLLTNMLEEEWKIKLENVYKSIYDKMSRRKPYLEEGREVTEEEAIEIWNKAKRAEGYPEHRLRTDERTRCD